MRSNIREQCDVSGHRRTARHTVTQHAPDAPNGDARRHTRLPLARSPRLAPLPCASSSWLDVPNGLRRRVVPNARRASWPFRGTRPCCCLPDAMWACHAAPYNNDVATGRAGDTSWHVATAASSAAGIGKAHMAAQHETRIELRLAPPELARFSGGGNWRKIDESSVFNR